MTGEREREKIYWGLLRPPNEQAPNVLERKLVGSVLVNAVRFCRFTDLRFRNVTTIDQPATHLHIWPFLASLDGVSDLIVKRGTV